MYAFRELERANKRKGITISVVLHSILFLLAIIPFVVIESEPELEQAIVIDFRDMSSNTRSGSTSASASASPATRAKVAMASIAAPKASAPIKPSIAKPVITSPQPDIQIPPADNFFDTPVDISDAPEVDEVHEMVDTPSEQTSDFDSWGVADVDEPDGEPEPIAIADGDDGGPGVEDGESDFDGDFEGDAESGDDPFADGLFNGDWPGDTDGTEGKHIGTGTDGDGNYWGDFAGEGLFNRKVIKRANVARLAIQEGKLVVNLCVDQTGEVTFVECDRGMSTIADDQLVTMAENCASNYVFDQDPSAPEKQCGRLTFVFKIDD